MCAEVLSYQKACMVLLWILSGLLLLYVGAELLVRHASASASMLGVSKLIVGLTIVAYGTSTPELMVNLVASIQNNTDIAVGNIVGSNIFNVLFVLGISAIAYPLAVHRQIIRLDVPIMIGVSIVLWLLSLNGALHVWTGALLLLGIIAYTVFLVYYSKTQSQDEFVQNKQEPLNKKRLWKHLAWIAASLGLLTIGSECLVNGAIQLARMWGVSELMISLTIVAAGTSLPELATSLLATIRGHRDIAVGNVVGSNIYNILAILGISAIVAPDGLPISESVLWIDLPIMVASAIACFPIFATGHTIYRWEGCLLVFYYFLYLTNLVLQATDNPFFTHFHSIVYIFLLPLTLIALFARQLNWYIQKKFQP